MYFSPTNYTPPQINKLGYEVIFSFVSKTDYTELRPHEPVKFKHQEPRHTQKWASH